jgi:hypothetical protein
VLHEALLAHPHLTELMTDDHTGFLREYADDFLDVTLREGIPRELAISCCRSLLNVTINEAVVEVRATARPDHPARTIPANSTISRNLPETIRWILAGVRAQSSRDAPTGCSEGAVMASRPR